MDLQALLESLIREAPEARLDNADRTPVYGQPIMGVADGDDPVFESFREAVSPDILMPRALLRDALGREPDRVRVIVWVLPFSDAVRASNRRAGCPSVLYSVARNSGGALNYRLRGEMAGRLRDEGWAAVVPVLAPGYDAFRNERYAFSSTWSERHAAYAAGLGRSGLSNALLTAVGSNVRFGSVVTDYPAEVTPRADDDWRAPCLASGGETCGACIARCPVRAISAAGVDKNLCNTMRKTVREAMAAEFGAAGVTVDAPVTKKGETQRAFSFGCALCQCGVPCEAAVPSHPRKEQEAADA